MRFLEDVPVVGYAIAGIDELEGDEVSSKQRIVIVLQLLTIFQDEAKRALAECTYSTLITAGAIAGFAFTGPIGAAMGSAFGAMVGLEAKAGIGLSINDPQMRNQVTSISVWQVLSIVASLAMAVPIDMVISGLMDALAEGVFEDGLLARAWQQAISEGDGALGKYGLKTVGADEAKK
jgi:hypothetical protein